MRVFGINFVNVFKADRTLGFGVFYIHGHGSGILLGFVGISIGYD